MERALDSFNFKTSNFKYVTSSKKVQKVEENFKKLEKEIYLICVDVEQKMLKKELYHILYKKAYSIVISNMLLVLKKSVVEESRKKIFCVLIFR